MRRSNYRDDSNYNSDSNSNRSETRGRNSEWNRTNEHFNMGNSNNSRSTFGRGSDGYGVNVDRNIDRSTSDRDWERDYRGDISTAGYDYDEYMDRPAQDERGMRSRPSQPSRNEAQFRDRGMSEFGERSSSFNGSHGGMNSSRYGQSMGGSTSYGEESRGGFFGKGPKGWKRSDERLREEVCEALYRDTAIDASEIDVTVAEGTVTLSGTVDSRKVKRAAEDCVENLIGVHDVRNELRVSSNVTSMNGESSFGSRSTDASSGTKEKRLS